MWITSGGMSRQRSLHRGRLSRSRIRRSGRGIRRDIRGSSNRGDRVGGGDSRFGCRLRLVRRLLSRISGSTKVGVVLVEIVTPGVNAATGYWMLQIDQ